MPYKSMDDVNPSLKGIKPPITLAQANTIAKWADAMTTAGTKGAWPIAISQFKKLYHVEDGRWVRKPASQEADVPDYRCPWDGCGVPLVAELFDGWYRCPQCGRDAYITVPENDGEGPLVKRADEVPLVPKPRQPRVAQAVVSEAATIKAQAKRLMRELTGLLALRELPSAIRKEVEDVRTVLRRTWADLESEAADEKQAAATEAGESVGEFYGMPMAGGDEARPFGGATDFEQLDEQRALYDIAQAMGELGAQFHAMMENILVSGDIADKPAAMNKLVAQYAERSAALSVNPPDDEEQMMGEGAEVAELAEAETGQVRDVVDVREADDGLVYIDFVIIEPGFGNKRDNYFYPAPMLRENASVFAGAKMYETDHRQDEKSTRTWVSTCKEIVGYTDSGAPIGRAVVHDPSFAQRAKNLRKAGLLELLTNSIVAKALYRVVERDGQQVNEIQRLLPSPKPDIDWVTRAGAGGHAVTLTETEATVKDNAKPDDEKDVQEDGLHEATIREQDAKAPEQPATDTTTEQPPAEAEATGEPAEDSAPDTTEEPETVAPQTVPVERVKELVAAANLPAGAAAMLEAQTFVNEAAVGAQITAMEQFIRDVRSAGRVIGNTGGTPPASVRTVAEVAADERERIAAVLKRRGMIKQ